MTEMTQAAGPGSTMLDARALTAALRRELGEGDAVVLWEHRGDRVLVHAGELEAEPRGTGLVVTVPLETDQTGRGDVVVVLALARGDAPPDRTAVTHHRPSGDPLLVARWGALVQDAVFEALLRAADATAAQDGLRAHGMRAADGGIELAHAPAHRPPRRRRSAK